MSIYIYIYIYIYIVLFGPVPFVKTIKMKTVSKYTFSKKYN